MKIREIMNVLGMEAREFMRMGISICDDDEMRSLVEKSIVDIENNFECDLNEAFQDNTFETIAPEQLVVQVPESADTDYRQSPNPDFLPKMPFSGLVYGTKGSGKSTVAFNFMRFYKGYFENIYIFSPTIALDPKYQAFIREHNIPIKNVIPDYSESILTKILNSAKKYNADRNENEKTHTLIILDDVINKIPFHRTILNHFACNHRHPKISFLVLSQYYKKINPTIRNNFTFCILLQEDNPTELRKIKNEVGGVLLPHGRNLFEQAYDRVLQTPHGFMMYRKKVQPVYKSYTIGFNRYLFDQNFNIIV